MLAAGTRLGSYEVISAIGAGGMGEVYRARDTRLDRIVAIKVVSAALASAPELRERFDREARAIAALNHPHICTLHDVGRHEDLDFLVMEHLDGETLEQRLKKGQLPIDQAVAIGVEIADALAAAHRAGIVHRDLKPGNVMLTKSGAKLLDFGLAKTAIAGAGVTPAGASMLPTTPPALTQQGTILGTFQYMAPEQLEGQEADARSDIFAFGAVLYEMLAGRKAFDAKSHASLIAAILDHQPPPLTAVNPALPRALQHVVDRCLAKNPDERWQTAADLHRELMWAAAAPADAPAAAAPQRGAAPLWQRPVPLAAVVGVAALAACAAWAIPRAVATPAAGGRVARLAVVLQPDEELAGLAGPAVALSPDGTQVAYVAASGGRQLLHLRAIDRSEVTILPGTEQASFPFFSPDGQWLGFFGQGKLKKVSVASGTTQVVADAPFGVGGTWHPDGTIYFTAVNNGGLSKVQATGGAVAAVTTLDAAAGEVSHRWPQLLPGGTALMFNAWRGPGDDEKSVDVVELATGRRMVVAQGGQSPQYSPTGHIVYARSDDLFAIRFNLQGLRAVGEPVRLEESVYIGGEGTSFSVSANGDLAYVSGSPLRYERQLSWVARDGRIEPLSAPPRAYTNAVLSPDERRAAVNVDAGTVEIAMYDFARGSLTTVATPGSSQAPRWTADGARLTYRGTRAGSRTLWWRAIDTGAAEEQLLAGPHIQTPSMWSSDGEWLVYSESHPETASNIWTLPRGAKATPRALVNTPFTENAPRLSPDGRWLAYQSDEPGRTEVFVQPFPEAGPRVQISSDGGTEPVWSRDGRELFYLNGSRMMAVAVEAGSAFKAGTPRTLFEGRFTPGPNGVAGYDVAADGRFLMVQPLHPDPPTNQIQVVLNWVEELRRRVN